MQAKVEATRTETESDLRVLASDALWDDEALIAFGERIDMKVERIGGQLVVSPPMGFDGGRREMRLSILLGTWAENHGYEATSPSADYRLADGDAPAPDVGLVRTERVKALTPKERKGFAPLVPDIAIELLSESQRSPSAKTIARTKCERWLEAGAAFVLLVDPFARTVTLWGNAPPDFPDLTSVFESPES